MEIAIVSVPVRDQDQAKSFYIEKFGFREVSDERMDEDRRWVLLAPPGGGASVTLVTWFPTMPPGSMKGLVYEVDDVVATRQQLRTRGVTVGDVQNEPWGDYVQVDDSDGNGIVLQHSRAKA